MVRQPNQSFEAERTRDDMSKSVVGNEDGKVLVFRLGNCAIVGALFNQLEGDQQLVVLVDATPHLSIRLADFLVLLVPKIKSGG